MDTAGDSVTYRLMLSAVLIVVTLVILEWFESWRARMTLARRQRREELGTGSAMRLPEHIPTRHHRRPREEGDSMKSLLAAFTPTIVMLQSARVVGDRIYILLLIADGDGEETMKRLSPEEPAANDSSRESLPPGGGYRY